MGCDVTNDAIAVDVLLFQSTHPHGVRLRAIHSSHSPHGFNPRTRMGCDPAFTLGKTLNCSFNPRTRMGCDLVTALGQRGREVSIHAPAWGATSVGRRMVVTTWFQSTHPHGVRLSRLPQKEEKYGVSIHAPAWGATYIN